MLTSVEVPLSYHSSRNYTPHPIATLLAYARAAETLAQDDAMDLLDTLLMNLVRQATGTAQQIRLRTLKDLDAAALQLSTVCTYLINPDYADAEIRTTIYAAIPQETITAAVETIEAPGATARTPASIRA